MAALLSACQAVNYGPPVRQQVVTPVRVADPVAGAWVDPNGIVSYFDNGRFETRTTDTNSLLAEGSYAMASPRMVQIDMTSRVRDTTSNVNCALVTPEQLNCTTEGGSQFSLARRAAG
jgi:hypothetical protein